MGLGAWRFEVEGPGFEHTTKNSPKVPSLLGIGWLWVLRTFLAFLAAAWRSGAKAYDLKCQSYSAPSNSENPYLGMLPLLLTVLNRNDNRGTVIPIQDC